MWVWGVELSDSAVDEIVTAIANSIRPFALDIRRGMYDDGKMYLAVVNTVSSCGCSEILSR